MPNDYIVLYTAGGKPVNLPATPTATPGTYIIPGIIPSGLGSTTAGVTDSVNKRFVTDAELTVLQNLANKASEGPLALITGVNMNTATPQTLYTVPALKRAIVTKFIFINPSDDLDVVTASIGYGDPAYADVVSDTAIGLTAGNHQNILAPKGDAYTGIAGEVLKLKCSDLQGSAATVDILVYGFLV